MEIGPADRAEVTSVPLDREVEFEVDKWIAEPVVEVGFCPVDGRDNLDKVQATVDAVTTLRKVHSNDEPRSLVGCEYGGGEAGSKGRDEAPDDRLGPDRAEPEEDEATDEMIGRSGSPMTDAYDGRGLIS